MLLTAIEKENVDKVSPREFLEWAKHDLKNNNKQAIGNSLGNLKKAIHCRIDEIIDKTHIRHCDDWNQKADTALKLEALGLLGITTSQAIVKLLTEIRNVYEHQYLLIPYDKAKVYYDIAEMWLDVSYSNFSFHRIAITGLEASNMEEFGLHVNGQKRKVICKFKSIDKFDYLWLSKKEIHEYKNSNLKIIKMNTVKWKTMAQYEAKHIIYSSKANKLQYLLTGTELTSIYKKALKVKKSKK